MERLQSVSICVGAAEAFESQYTVARKPTGPVMSNQERAVVTVVPLQRSG